MNGRPLIYIYLGYIYADVQYKYKIYNLLDNFTGRVKINETLVDLQFITVPGLGTLTTRLNARYTINKKECI